MFRFFVGGGIDKELRFVYTIFRKLSKYYTERGGSMALSETLRAISDPVRREIIEMLKYERKTAGEIGAAFNLTAATVSYHLSTLKRAGILSECKQGKYVFYELNLSVFEEILLWMKSLGGKYEKN